MQNLRLRADVAVDEIIAPYHGRSSEKTTVPNKPNPTGVKFWGIAQINFLLRWNFHTPGEGNGPIGVLTPIELGGTKKGKGGNKTQAVAAKLLLGLPPPINPETNYYHCSTDNLFNSIKFLTYMRSKGIGITGTCRTNSGIYTELIKLKTTDRTKDIIPWGTTYCYPSTNRLVNQIA